jgi:dihydrofolate reductase
MRKVIAAINMTIDGFCDHTAGLSDEEVHEHYTELLDSGGVILYGRITYELMKFWQTLLTTPSGKKSMYNFAKAIDRIPKVVFSNTLKDTGWTTATLSNQSLEQEIAMIKQQPGKDILVGSRSLIIQLLKLNVLDEVQLCIQPVVAGKASLPLFEHLNDRTIFKLAKTKMFKGGSVILYYQPADN